MRRKSRFQNKRRMKNKSKERGVILSFVPRFYLTRSKEVDDDLGWCWWKKPTLKLQALFIHLLNV
jgi:hypothetical protein